MTAVYTESVGTGPDVVLIHGWGLHGGVWSEVAAHIARRCRVTLVDLPGHGRSGPLGGVPDLEAMAGAVVASVPADAVWVGWSLGGLVALAAATRVTAVRRLVLVGTNPRFAADGDWPGMNPELLTAFAADLNADYRTTLSRFLALQTRGAEGGRETLRELRTRLFARGAPDRGALEAGLAILAEADLRGRLPAVKAPALVIQGGRDTLVPAAAASRTAEQLQAELALFETAGHAPFLSHPEPFNDCLETFVHG